MWSRLRFASCLALLVAACQSGSQRKPAAYSPQPQYPGTPAQYPPNQYPPNQYPPNQYPANQYPPNQYPPPAQYPPAQPPPAQYPSTPAPPGVALPSAPLPAVTNDPINTLNIGWLRQSSHSILNELVAALPDSARARVQNIPLVIDDTPGDVNAFAACANGKAAMAVTDGMLEIIAWLAMSVAHDELFGTTKTDEYISFIAKNLAPDRPIPRPSGFFPANTQNDGRKVQRQHVVFEEQLAFVLGHELAHHHLGHLPCTGNPGPLGSADLARLLSNQIPLLNQPNEAAADLAGTTNVLDAGKRRSGAHWSEAGGLLTMRFFAGLEGRPNLLLSFQHSHPPPQFRIPLIQQSAGYWRRSGGVGIPVPRIGG